MACTGSLEWGFFSQSGDFLDLLVYEQEYTYEHVMLKWMIRRHFDDIDRREVKFESTL